MTTSPRTSKGANITAWTLQCLVAAAFFGAGGAKLAGVPMLVELFNQLGVGQWFRYVTALVEISGAIMLLTPRFSGFGGLLLATTMFFAVLTHLFILHSNPMGAVMLLLLSATILWLRRDQLSQVRSYFVESRSQS